MVKWKEGATKPNYPRAVANTRLVGRQIGMLVEALENHFRIEVAQRTHIVGFSLGAHVAGNAGMYLAEKKSGMVTIKF